MRPCISLSIVAAAVAALVLLADGTAARAAEAEGASPVAKGRDIVAAKCGRCHAIGAEGHSQHPQAPPFRDVVKRYRVENLAEALAEGIVSGHPDMPVFVFDPPEIEAILAYLDSLGGPAKTPD